MSNGNVYGKMELTGTSPEGIEKAVQVALDKAAEKVKHIRWFEVVETRGYVEENNVAYWQVTIKVGYNLEDF